MFCKRPAVSISNTSHFFLAGAGEGIESEPGGVRADPPRQDLGPRPFTPDLELVDGSGPERVAGGQHYRPSILAQLMRKLADGGGLAGAVDPDHQDDVGAVIAFDPQGLGHRRQHPLDLGGQHGTHFLGGDFLAVAAFCQGGGNTHGSVYPEVCLDQQIFQLLQGIGVELPFRKDAGNVLRQLCGCLGQPGL